MNPPTASLFLMLTHAAIHSPSTLDQIVKATEVFLLLVALVTLIISIRQTKAAESQATAAKEQSEEAGEQSKLLRQQLEREDQRRKKDRSYGLIARWNNPGFDERRELVAAFLRSDPSPEEIDEKRDADAAFRGTLSLILNFFEEAAIAWRSESLDRETFFDFFGGIVLQYWDWLEPWVYHHRRRRDDDHPRLDSEVARGIWIKTQEMHEDVRRRVQMMRRQDEI